MRGGDNGSRHAQVIRRVRPNARVPSSLTVIERVIERIIPD